jgi:NAD(P)-dependent dehydrogenase (short-subunit alcohol dehydrogenase family)
MNKTAIITGASSGIGFALAQELSQQGITVIACGRDERKLHLLKTFSPENIQIVASDLTNSKGIQAVVNEVTQYSRIDYIIHCAAIVEPIESIYSIDRESLQNIMEINFHAPLFLTQSLLAKCFNSRVLFLTSDSSLQPVKGAAGYCISKAALYMLWEQFKTEIPTDVATFGIVTPGVVDTSMQETIRQSSFKIIPAAETLNQLYENGQLLRPETSALFLVWLLLELESEFVSSRVWDIYDQAHHAYWRENTTGVLT